MGVVKKPRGLHFPYRQLTTTAEGAYRLHRDEPGPSRILDPLAERQKTSVVRAAAGSCLRQCATELATTLRKNRES
jgi:hypothetical protein